MSDSAADIRAVAAEMSQAAPAAPAPEPQATAPEPAAQAEAQPATPSRARDEGGRFAKPQPTPSAQEAQAETEPAAEPTATGAVPTTQAEPPKPAATRKPPQSWPAAAREKFAALHPEVQEVVLKREAQIAHALNESAESRKGYEAFQKVLQPYTPHLQALGIQPTQAVETMLRTDYALRTSPGPQKAHIFAQLMQTYGVTPDVLADAIEGMRSGQPPPQQAAQPQQFRDPRFDEFMGTLKQRQQVKLQREVSTFAEKHEFFEDVRVTMSAIMDAASAQGEALTMEDAYERACYSTPSVRSILLQRQSTQANAQASTQRARAASSSVRTEPTASAAPASGGSAASDVRAVASALRSR